MPPHVGQVVAVTEEIAGSELEQVPCGGALFLSESLYLSDDLYLGGASQLDVIDPIDFGDTGLVQLVAVDGITETANYEVPEEDPDVVNLDATITGTYEVGDRVNVLAPDGSLIKERWADVLEPGGEEVIHCRVPHTLYDRLALGIREGDKGEMVKFASDGVDTVITDVLGRKPEVDGSFIIPGTQPQGDDTPPGSSPTPTVSGGLGALVVKWDAIDSFSTVTYEVHVSTSSGFTPDDTTLAQESKGTLAWIRALPDGTALDYETTYYVVIVANNADGSADPSDEASGSPQQVDSPDIAANAIIAEHILSGEITAEKLAAILIISSAIKTAESGQRVEIDTDGIKWYDSSGNLGIIFPTQTGQPAIIDANIVAAALDITGPANFRDSDNTLDVGAQLALQSTLTNPGVAPSVNVNFEELDLTGGNAAQVVGTGLFYTSTGGSGGGTATFYASQDTATASVLEEYNASTGAFVRTLFTAPTGETIYGAVQASVSSVLKIFVLTGVVFGGIFIPKLYRLDNSTKVQEVEHALVDDTDYQIAGTVANDASVGTVAWDHTAGAASLQAAVSASDDIYAFTAFDSGATASNYLKLTNFGFAVPANATVTGISVQIERSSDFTASVDNVVKLVKGGTVSGNNKASGAQWPLYPSDAVATYGGTGDLWGVTLTPSDVNASDFGMVLSAKVKNSGDIATPFVDRVRVKVHYKELQNSTASGSAALGLIGTNPTVISYSSTSQTSASVARLFTISKTNLQVTGTQDLSGETYTPQNNAPRFTGIVSDGTSLWVAVRNDPVHGFVNHRYNAATFAYESNHDFSGTAFYSRGLTWDGTQFWSRLAGQPQLAKHTTWDWTTESPIYWIAYTWYDGTNESIVSPLTQIDLTDLRRSRLLITVPPFPDGITKARVYVARNATAPATTALKLQAPTTYVDTDSGVSIHEIGFNGSGAAPPTSSGFTTGTPAVIHATQLTGTNWSLQGDGTFRLPSYTTTERDALTTTLRTGWTIYNSTTGKLNFWDGTAWRAVTSA